MLSACDGAARPPEVGVRDSAGIAIVVSHPDSVPDDVWRIDAAPLLRLGDDEGGLEGGGRELHRVAAAVRVGPEIVVANAGTGEILWFDGAGAHVATAGGMGEGPGEFMDLGWIGRGGDGAVLAWDRRLRRLSVFRDRSFVRDIRPDLPLDVPYPAVHGVLRGGGPDGGDVVVASPGPVYVPQGEPGVQRPPMPLWLFPPAGAGLDTLGPFPGTAVNLRPARGAGWIRTEVPFGASTLVATGAERIVVGDNADYELRVLDAGGDAVRILRVLHAPREVTQRDVEAELERRLEGVPDDERIRGGIRASFRATPPPERMPSFDALLVDRTGHIWVRRVAGAEDARAGGEAGREAGGEAGREAGDDVGRAADRAGRVWDVFDADGRLLGTVRSPGGLRITEIGEDYVLGVRTNELGVESVEVHRLTRGRSSPVAAAEVRIWEG